MKTKIEKSKEKCIYIYVKVYNICKGIYYYGK